MVFLFDFLINDVITVCDVIDASSTFSANAMLVQGEQNQKSRFHLLITCFDSRKSAMTFEEKVSSCWKVLIFAITFFSKNHEIRTPDCDPLSTSLL